MTNDCDTRVDVVCVREPDYNNVFYVFVNGVLSTGPDAAEATGSSESVTVRVWDFDFGADDLTDPANWTDEGGPWWTGPDPFCGMVCPPRTVRERMESIIEYARRWYL